MPPPRPELPEKDFINEGYSKNPYPLWLWLFLLTIFAAVAWGISGWYNTQMGSILRANPFLQVTNRDLSLYLWQNPEYMRVHAKEKANYLPGFKYVQNVTMDLAASDHYAEAPPELLFLYHTWRRLVSSEFIQRPMIKEEFERFLNETPEWRPRYWPAAPEAYIALVGHLPEMPQGQDLASLSRDELPLDVRIAFQGWKNFFLEGEAIEHVKPTVSQMRQFLAVAPHYARNYWRNIVAKQAPNYLKAVSSSEAPDEQIPPDQLTPFLKVAFYNYSMARRG